MIITVTKIMAIVAVVVTVMMAASDSDSEGDGDGDRNGNDNGDSDNGSDDNSDSDRKVDGGFDDRFTRSHDTASCKDVSHDHKVSSSKGLDPGTSGNKSLKPLHLPSHEPWTLTPPFPQTLNPYTSLPTDPETLSPPRISFFGQHLHTSRQGGLSGQVGS